MTLRRSAWCSAFAVIAILLAHAASADGRAVAAGPETTGEEARLGGSLPLTGGMGMALWSGGAASALAEAARDLGCNVAAVHANSPGGGLVRYLPTALRSPNREFHAAYPNGLPPSSPVMVECAAPGAPRIAFLGDVPADRQSRLRAEIERVQTFFSERYDVRAPNFSVYLAPNFSLDLAADFGYTNPVYRETRPGQAFGTQALTHQMADRELLIFISGRFLHEGFGEVFAQAYFHLLQAHLRGGYAVDAVPWWLMKGAAAYAGNLYDPTRKPSERWVLWQTHKVTDQLEDLKLEKGWPEYLQASTAFERLVDWYGDGTSHIEFWRRLKNATHEVDRAEYGQERARALARQTWQTAFESIFGITFRGFQDRYTEYRNSLYGRIHARIQGFRNAGLAAEESLHCWSDTGGREHCTLHQGKVYLTAGGDDYGYWEIIGNVDDSDDGVATIRVPEGDYTIELRYSISVGNTEIGASAGDYNSETGTLEQQCGHASQRPRVRVKNGANVTLAINTPRFYLFRAMVLYADGTPVPQSGAKVEAYGLASEPCIYRTLYTGGPGGYGEGGLFIHVPDGSSFTLHVTADGRDVGWWDGDGFTADRARAKTLTLRGADLAGVQIRLPATQDGK